MTYYIGKKGEVDDIRLALVTRSTSFAIAFTELPSLLGQPLTQWRTRSSETVAVRVP